MIGRRSHYIPVAGHEIHVSEWGDPSAPAVVMAHGLARVGRDFDTAAAHLATRFRVLCPDTIGRGLSSWSARPDDDYTVEAYAGHAAPLLDALGVESCAWIGTSMGGLIGLVATAGPLRGRVTRLLLNDVAPVLNEEAVSRIKAYVTASPAFATMAEFETFIRAVYAPWGVQSDAEWRRMAETSVRRRDDGRLTSHYDPEVMRVFAAYDEMADYWAEWDSLACPVTVLRGESSDLLLPETLAETARRGPRARTLTLPGCGHAPALNTPEQLAILDEFLDG